MIILGRIVASIKVFPTSIDVKLDDLKETIKQVIPKSDSVHSFKEEPIAFGLVALITNIIMPDDVEGEMDKIEETLKKIESVSEIQVLMVRKI